MSSWREEVNADSISAAAKRLEEVGARTPLQRSDRLSERYGAEVYLKREDLQCVRSYKIRGAYNFIATLDPARAASGVVCASAGNHAQGVAWCCAHLGVHGAVFLPSHTPHQKVERIRTIGGDRVDVHFSGPTFDHAIADALAHAEATGATMVSAFDHPLTVSGQGTVMKEILDELPSPPDLVVIPVGGGGLISGMAAWADASHAPTTLVGAQPAGSPAMSRCVEAGHPVTITITDDFVDGASVATPGKLPVTIVSELLPTLLSVGEGRVSTALLELYQDDGIVAEPAGALSIAALDQVPGGVTGTTVVCVLSGGNNDVARYEDIIERSLLDRGLKHYFIVGLPDQPGALRHFLDDCLGPNDDITLFDSLKRARRAHGAALVGVELSRPQDLQPLLSRMSASGLDIVPIQPGSAAYHYLV